jgi:hypothetical protein
MTGLLIAPAAQSDEVFRLVNPVLLKSAGWIFVKRH